MFVTEVSVVPTIIHLYRAGKLRLIDYRTLRTCLFSPSLIMNTNQSRGAITNCQQIINADLNVCPDRALGNRKLNSCHPQP